MLYAGADVDRRTTYLTVMDEAGTVLQQRRVPSTSDGLQAALGRYDEPLKVVIEASYAWGPLYDALEEMGAEVVLAHPAKVKAIAEARIKTDKIDSETLAHLLRADLIPAAYAPSPEIRAIKRVLRQRMFLVRVQTMLKNRIQALLSQHELGRPAVSDLFGKRGWTWLEGLRLPEPDGTILREDLSLLRTVIEHIGKSNALVARLAGGEPAVAWLASMPGIGPFLSVLIRYEVDDMRRFRTPGKFAAYTGLVPSTYASGRRMVHGRLTKQGNKWLRWAFVEAVTPAVRTSPWLRRYYEGIKRRRGAKDARTATARKLAQLAHALWTEERCYEER